jgi:hypothetical protein
MDASFSIQPTEKVRLTHQGKLLREYAMTVFSDSKHFKENISSVNTDTMQFSFGAT